MVKTGNASKNYDRSTKMELPGKHMLYSEDGLGRFLLPDIVDNVIKRIIHIVGKINFRIRNIHDKMKSYTV